MGQVFPDASTDAKNKLLKMIGKYGNQFGLDNKYALEHFLAQAGYESGGFTDLSVTENLNYTVQNLLDTFGNLFSLTDPQKADPRKYAGKPKKIGNFVYAYINGNRGVASGDGYRYRGRGIFQISQKNNYLGFTNFVQNNNLGLSVNFVSNPNLIANSKKFAILSAMWFYKKHVLDQITVNKNTSVEAITRIVNGKRMNGLQGRKEYFQDVNNGTNINCNN